MRTDSQRKLIFGLAIGGLAVWAGIMYWPPAESRAASTPTISAIKTLRDVPRDMEDIEQPAPPVWADDAGSVPWPANPFFRERPAVAQEAEAVDVFSPASGVDYVLTAILSGEPPMAMIDGRLVGVGDKLGDQTIIIGIDGSTVTIREPDQTRVLRLPK